MKRRDKVLGFAVIGSLVWFSVSYLTTPRRVARLIAELRRPDPGMTCYDPCCGSGRLPLAGQRAAGRSPGDRVRIFAQEINPVPFVAAAVNRRMHNLEMVLTRGSSLRRPAFICANGGLQRFDLAVANPMWNQHVSQTVYRGDRFGRFIRGWPSQDGDWVWMQHLLAHLADGGRMVVMLDRETTSRSDDLPEVDVRKNFVESDLIEAVVLCPPRNLRSTIVDVPGERGIDAPNAAPSSHPTLAPPRGEEVAQLDGLAVNIERSTVLRGADLVRTGRPGRDQQLGQEHPCCGSSPRCCPGGRQRSCPRRGARNTGLRSGVTHRRLRPAGSGPLSPGGQG